MKNKSRYDMWAKLGTSKRPKVSTVIKLADHPEIKRLEDAVRFGLLVDCPPLEAQAGSYDEIICQKVFGITRKDTLYSPPEDYWDLHKDDVRRWEIDKLWDLHEEQYQTEEMTDDEVVEYFKGFNIDLNALDGQPLRCTKIICRVVEAAAKGLAGNLPDWEHIKLMGFEARLAEDAKTFKARKF